MFFMGDCFKTTIKRTKSDIVVHVPELPLRAQSLILWYMYQNYHLRAQSLILWYMYQNYHLRAQSLILWYMYQNYHWEHKVWYCGTCTKTIIESTKSDIVVHIPKLPLRAQSLILWYMYQNYHCEHKVWYCDTCTKTTIESTKSDIVVHVPELPLRAQSLILWYMYQQILPFIMMWKFNREDLRIQIYSIVVNIIILK